MDGAPGFGTPDTRSHMERNRNSELTGYKEKHLPLNTLTPSSPPDLYSRVRNGHGWGGLACCDGTVVSPFEVHHVCPCACDKGFRIQNWQRFHREPRGHPPTPTISRNGRCEARLASHRRRMGALGTPGGGEINGSHSHRTRSSSHISIQKGDQDARITAKRYTRTQSNLIQSTPCHKTMARYKTSNDSGRQSPTQPASQAGKTRSVVHVMHVHRGRDGLLLFPRGVVPLGQGAPEEHEEFLMNIIYKLHKREKKTSSTKETTVRGRGGWGPVTAITDSLFSERYGQNRTQESHQPNEEIDRQENPNLTWKLGNSMYSRFIGPPWPEPLPASCCCVWFPCGGSSKKLRVSPWRSEQEPEGTKE